MSSMVSQGLQSCLEPRALGLKMVSTKSHFLKPTNWAESLLAPNSEPDAEANDKIDNKKQDNDSGGWSFMQTLANASSKEDREKLPYVHPVYKRSASQLTTKSLELCTETLGSETGSDTGDDIDISISSSDSEGSKSPTKERFLRCSKASYRSLPPPLTSISGSNCYSIKPHREGGRLVMKAVAVPTPNTCFHAERRDGRLKLHFIKKSPACVYSSESSDSEQEMEEDYLDEETDGDNANVGGEFGKEAFQTPSRCKEGGRGNRGLLTWGEPFWVAT